jgi:hypothetical protein
MPKNKTIYLVVSGDLRLAANQTCQAAQAALENDLTEADSSTAKSMAWRFSARFPPMRR